MKTTTYLKFILSFTLFSSTITSAMNNSSRLMCDESNFCTRESGKASSMLFKLTGHDTPFHRYKKLNHHGSRYDHFQTFARSDSSSRRATGNSVFIFDPRKLRWYAYDRHGSLIGSGAASGGRHYCRDVGRACKTPSGTFKVHRKGSASCRSSKYPLGRGGAPMPYCMFFHRGYAIHGSPNVPNYNASHGCIRVKPHIARHLHRNVIGIGTTVIVRSY